MNEPKKTVSPRYNNLDIDMNSKTGITNGFEARLGTSSERGRWTQTPIPNQEAIFS